MMETSLFEKNIEALEEKFSELAHKIKNNVYELKNNISIEMETAKDFSSIFKIKKDNRTLYINGKYEPKKEAEAIIADMGKLNRGTTIFLLGMGDGLILKEILDHTDDEINIAVFEPSIDIFIYAMKHIDLREIYRKRTIGLVVNGLNEEEKEAVINSFLVFGNINYIKKIIHPNYNELFSEDIIKDMKNIKKRIEKILMNENTVVRFSSVMAENIFRNIVYICDSYKAEQICKVIPLDIPAIIVAAGPSLNKNIKELKRAKNRAFIIAVDTALKPLIKERIIPDLFVTVDGVKPLELIQLEEIKNIPMLGCVSASSKIFEFHKGKKFYFREYFPYIDKIFDDLNIMFREVDTGGSVATTAFSFAYLSGFSTIILVGQDLALTNNRTHADGTFKEKMDEIDTRFSIKVEGNIEKFVPTRADFKSYLEWYNDYIAKCQDMHVINATEGGAKINNTEILSLKEAIDRECKKEVIIEECFNKLEPMFSEEQREKVIEYFHSTPQMLKDLKRKAIKGKKLYKKLLDAVNNKKVDRHLYKKLNKKIAIEMNEIESMPIFSIIVECFAVANYLIRREQYEEEEDFREEIKGIARKGITVLEYVIQCVELFLPLVEETVCKMK